MPLDALPLFSSISASFSSFRGSRLGRNIAVISTDEDVRTAACWVLELLGCKSTLSCGAEEAAAVGDASLPQRLAAERVDLVLCDLELAGALLEGFRAVNAATAGEQGTSVQVQDGTQAAVATPPVVLLAGKRAEKRRLNACLDAGAQGYVTKPLRIQAIRAVVVRYACGDGGACPAALAAPAAAAADGVCEDGEEAERRSPRQQLSRYEKSKVLGQGACGTVYMVRRVRDGARFALKELTTDRLSAAEQRRVVEELRLHRAFDCPLVVRYYTSWIEEDMACLLLEFVENGSLSNQVSKCKSTGGQLSDASIVDWVGQISVALLYLHMKDVVHRDLKLDNVLGPDSAGCVKLADFGIAKRLTGELAMSLVGTPEIMAPERCAVAVDGSLAVPEGEGGYGSASDMWSLGVILYELATLQPPFAVDDAGSGEHVSSASKSQQQLFERILKEEPAPLPFGRAAVLHKLVPGSLLRKQPQARPSASDLCRDAELGASIYRFLKRQRLLEHPSILEIIDVLPASETSGRSRLESSDLDVVTLRAQGLKGTFPLASSIASSCGFLDGSRLKSSELSGLPGEVASLLAAASRGGAGGAGSSGSTTVGTVGSAEADSGASKARSQSPLPRATASTAGPEEDEELAALEAAMLVGNGRQADAPIAEAASNAQTPERHRRRSKRRLDTPPIEQYQTHPQRDPPREPRDPVLDRLAVSPAAASTGSPAVSLAVGSPAANGSDRGSTGKTMVRRPSQGALLDPMTPGSSPGAGGGTSGTGGGPQGISSAVSRLALPLPLQNGGKLGPLATGSPRSSSAVGVLESPSSVNQGCRRSARKQPHRQQLAPLLPARVMAI
eukprot:TRINITY_DN21106_c0_g2_i1.p1 TRINITY_DN21106_c0_g2~~TRINITY_DN21106_c0_g2_i1.p1  ORF type:complete len:844 (-),score=211.97 TRINITY_DN21106_c0_g2_i1:113-2644(-)